MATISSPLGLCSLCRGVMARRFLSAGGESVSQSRSDFLISQHTCYVCAWFGQSLGSEKVQNLPGNFDRFFRFLFDGDRWSEPDGQYEYLVLWAMITPPGGESVEGLPIRLHFLATQDAECTDSFPLATSDICHPDLSTVAREWIQVCQQNHAECAPPKDGFRPKRLIQLVTNVAEDGQKKRVAKLMLPRDLPPSDKIDYVALSYCWGGDTTLLTLTDGTEDKPSRKESLFAGVELEQLPKTFNEAIKACFELGFDYIWIDSLCIIQDNNADWLEQAAEMGLVYRNAVLSLCMAGSAKPSDASLLSRKPNLMLPSSITLTGYDQKETTLRMVCDGLFEGDIKGSLLRERAWVFQEWYLAKRSLIFGRMQLWWHCSEELACETFPAGISNTTLFRYFVEEAETMKDKAPGAQQGATHTQEIWWHLIKQYAKTKLTEEPKDRVIAFSGIANLFGKSHNIEEQYAAGLWRCHLPQALLWYRFCGGETYRSSKCYKAPSWSWMSLDGPITLKDHSERSGFAKDPPIITKSSCCSVEQVFLSLVDERNATGQLNGGSIRIHGHLIGLDIKGAADDLDHQLSLSHFGNNRGMGETRWDEENNAGDKVVSYLDNAAMELGQGGFMMGSSRARVPLRRTDGSIFALPILHQTYTSNNRTDTMVSGLILYQSPHHSGIFQRVASYRISGDSEFATLTDRLASLHPARSICVV